MKSERKLNARILKRTMEIHESFPELSIFLDEMRVNLSYPPERIDDRYSDLKEYCNSLDALLKSYKSHHHQRI